MDQIKSKDLKPLTFKKFLQTDQRSKIPYLAEFASLYSDVANVHNFIDRYSKMLAKTPVATGVDPLSSGLDGTTLMIDKVANAGPFFNKTGQRPKTISEVLMEILYQIDVKIQDKDIAVELQNVKKKIGVSLFDPDMISDKESLNYQINQIIKNLDQLAADVWNDNESIGDSLDTTVYRLNGTGRQSERLTVRMLLNQLQNDMALLKEKVDKFIAQTSNRKTVEESYKASEKFLLYSFDSSKFTGVQLQYKIDSLVGYIMGKSDVIYFPITEVIQNVSYATITTSTDFQVKLEAERSGTIIELWATANQDVNKYSIAVTLFE